MISNSGRQTVSFYAKVRNSSFESYRPWYFFATRFDYNGKQKTESICYVKEAVMKNIIGFRTSEPQEPLNSSTEHRNPVPPVRSLVTVRFPGNGRALTYYNDLFDLEEGDLVFVSGKLAGQPGTVEKVTTRFKINLADYQRVISKANCEIHGTYEAICDKMVSFDRDAMSPDEFRSWILPPKGWDKKEGEPEDEIILGDGYELNLPALERDDEVDSAVLERAINYCREGKVAYICVRGGEGTAFIEGTEWYEVNFMLNGDSMTELYCDCPYPGLCKHMLAVAVTLRALMPKFTVSKCDEFVMLDSGHFWNMVARTTKKITL